MERGFGTGWCCSHLLWRKLPAMLPSIREAQETASGKPEALVLPGARHGSTFTRNVWRGEADRLRAEGSAVGRSCCRRVPAAWPGRSSELGPGGRTRPGPVVTAQSRVQGRPETSTGRSLPAAGGKRQFYPGTPSRDTQPN